MPLPKPITLAAIDTGSNAIRVIIANAHSAGDLVTVEAERMPIRLGHLTFTQGELDKKALEEAVGAYGRFRKLFEQHGVERYRAVATSAVRNANNREDLLDRIYREIGLDVEVIDGEEEARLVRKAVLHAFADQAPPSLIVDLGGGSLEVITRLGEAWQTSSMRIGTVRLLETFGLSGAISEDEGRMIRRYVASALSQSLPPESWDPSITEAAACGGNAEELAKLFGSTSKKERPTLKRSALEEALPKILAADVEERMKRWNVRKDRAEVMGVASLVLATVADHLKLKRLQVPGVGIREGVLLDLAEASVGDLRDVQEPARIAAARTFAARMAHNTAHGEQVRRISASLFDQLQDVHGLPEESRIILELAALLHDIGEVVHRRSHHKHSEYLILNGRIPGLESPMRELVAATARAHRKSPPDPKKHQTYGRLDGEQRELVRKLSALLRLADALDGDHRQQIVALSAQAKSKKILLQVSVERGGTASFPAGLRKSKLLEQEFGRKLVYEVKEVSSRPQIPLKNE